MTKEKGFALPIILVIIVVFGILAYGGWQYLAKNLKFSRSSTLEQSDLFKKITSVPQPEADFIKDGRLRLTNVGEETENWTFFYEEPGKPVLIVALNFNNRSKCDYGQGERICSEKHFENGMRVHIEGKKSDDNLTVFKLKILE